MPTSRFVEVPVDSWSNLLGRLSWDLRGFTSHDDGSYIYPGASTQKIATGRVLVTGGGGNIGKDIVRRLLASNTPVTIIDTLFYPNELSHPSRDLENQSLLRVHVDDIRNTTALASALTPDVVGIVHLAAVSRVAWCVQNQNDCIDVNERGTELVFDALTRLNTKDHGKRWFILASSREVYGDAGSGNLVTFREDAEKKPVNAYGASKLAAERIVQRHIEDLIRKADSSAGSIHAAALRLSNVYGGLQDHLERLVPSITTQALSHQVIQISGGEQDFDMLHIDDCIDAFMLAILHLTASVRSPSKWSFSPFSSPTFSFEAYNIASGFSAKIPSLVDTIVSLTRSESPVRYITADDRYPNVYRGDTTKARSTLGFKALISVQEGLKLFVTARLRHMSLFLSRTIEETCPGSNPHSIDTKHQLNLNMSKLDGCLVHVDLDVQGEFVGLEPPDFQQNSDHWSIRPLHAPDQRDPWATSLLVVSTSQPILIKDEDQENSRMLIRLRGSEKEVFADGKPSYLGVWRNSDDDPINPGLITLGRIFDSDLTTTSTSRRPLVDWELHVNPDPGEGSVRLVLPGTNPPLQLMNPTYIGGNFSLTRVDDELKHVWNIKLSPVCCPSPAPWPFSRDDPIEWSIEYQRTSLARPFHASPRKALCHRLARAQRRVEANLAALPLTATQNPQPLSRRMSRLPTEWAHANLPACSNICDDDHPSVCVDTGDCQCVLSSCVPRKRFPFSDHAYKNDLSFPQSSANLEGLAERMARVSWMSVVRPQVASYLSTHPRYPKIHVAPLSPSSARADGERVKPDKLSDMHCFSADAQLEKGLIRMGSVPANVAEMVFVTHYQNLGLWARENVEGFDDSKAVIPFTEDWGQCLDFAWDVWWMRDLMGLKLPPLMRSTTAWSVMGDLNSICYRPHQDVVIPPRTCLSPKLLNHFSSASSVKPARVRHVLATFSGSLWGTGRLNRERLICPRSGWHSGEQPTRRLQGLEQQGPDLTTIWGGLGGYDYMGILNNTIFCPQPAGTTGWATRLVDSIFAGCIPVLIGHATHPPYFDVLDWSKFSVRVEPSELSQLEDILLSRYTVHDIERLQVNLMLVRDAFVYPLDDMTEKEAQEMVLGGQEDNAKRGPLFWALHSTRLKMLTMWPVGDLPDRP
ncbi:NAD(P)-binding protein [Clavulina sp. PMI_390]|nr:NAD(P)-binding protein [Clavulina sp. PMI_390]